MVYFTTIVVDVEDEVDFASATTLCPPSIVEQSEKTVTVKFCYEVEAKIHNICAVLLRGWA